MQRLHWKEAVAEAKRQVRRFLQEEKDGGGDWENMNSRDILVLNGIAWGVKKKNNYSGLIFAIYWDSKD